MPSNHRLTVAIALAISLMPVATMAADEGSEQQKLEELRNTVINLLQTLVEKGLLTREQATLLVKQAQDKAAADATARNSSGAPTEQEEQNAVRVPYVPQIVQDRISDQVAKQVEPKVVDSVVAQAKTQGWGVPGALPDWVSRLKPFGDVTFRYQSDMYARDNIANSILDFNGINAAGGFSKDATPFLNVTENRDRLRVRARLGLDAQLSPNFTSEIRLSSGSLTDPSSESQTEGTYGQRWAVGIDRAYIRWNLAPTGQFSPLMIEGGRFENPWFSPTELVYARDLQFEGAAVTGRWGWGGGGADRSNVFLTVAGVPELEVPLEISQSKWLLGAQLGTGLRWADGQQHLTFAAGYYDFIHTQGVLNAPNSTLENPTAPAFIRFGNSVFDIASSTTTSGTNLFALASQFRLADVAVNYEYDFPRYSLAVNAEAVRNIGYHIAQVEALSPQSISSAQNHGYVADVSFGDPTVLERWQWRARLGYRYVQADAVIDAWTDADFHEGGTNARGYYAWGELGLAHNTWMRLRYLSGNEITGLPYGVDIIQLDMNTRF